MMKFAVKYEYQQCSVQVSQLMSLIKVIERFSLTLRFRHHIQNVAHHMIRSVGIDGGDVVDLRGQTLIMPAVAFANVGELAVDLLICTFKAQLVARLDSNNLLSCVGNNAYQQLPPGLLATACELYHIADSSIYLLQQRAPAMPGRQQAHAAELVDWITGTGVGKVLLLCGLDAQYRREHQMEGCQLRYLSSCKSSSSNSTAPDSASPPQPSHDQSMFRSCAAAGACELEADVIANEQELHGLLPPWPIMQQLQSRQIQHVLLCIFASEGDNTADAEQVASLVQRVLSHSGLLSKASQQLQAPCSWVGLFGRRAIDSTLF